MKTKRLVESGVLIAMAFVLSSFKIGSLPFGGSVTIASMFPIVYLAYRHGTTWGMFSSTVYAVLQIIQSDDIPPVNELSSFLLVVMLDFIIAFGVLGLADVFKKMVKNEAVGYAFGAFMVCTLRFVSHTLSGMVIWGSAFGASVAYNATYMVPEIILTTVLAGILCKKLVKINQNSL